MFFIIAFNLIQLLVAANRMLHEEHLITSFKNNNTIYR